MIYVGADHRGMDLKKKVVDWFLEKNVLVRDLGNNIKDMDDDYVDIAILLGEKVSKEEAMGILICGSGVGVTVASNKVKGVRAGFCFCPKQAKRAIEEDKINVLCLSSELVSEEENFEIIKTFINSLFVAEERYIRRINKIKKYETTNN